MHFQMIYKYGTSKKLLGATNPLGKRLSQAKIMRMSYDYWMSVTNILEPGNKIHREHRDISVRVMSKDMLGTQPRKA
jgi:hypothetical protein